MKVRLSTEKTNLWGCRFRKWGLVRGSGASECCRGSCAWWLGTEPFPGRRWGQLVWVCICGLCAVKLEPVTGYRIEDHFPV